MMNERMVLPRMKHGLNTDVAKDGGVRSLWRVVVRCSTSASHP